MISGNCSSCAEAGWASRSGWGLWPCRGKCIEKHSRDFKQCFVNKKLGIWIRQKDEIYPPNMEVSGQKLPFGSCGHGWHFPKVNWALHLAVLKPSGSRHVPSTDVACLLVSLCLQLCTVSYGKVKLVLKHNRWVLPSSCQLGGRAREGWAHTLLETKMESWGNMGRKRSPSSW